MIKKEGYVMLTVGQMSWITKEIMLGLAPSLTSEEALEHRRIVELEIEEMRKQGITPELPYDFDDEELPSYPCSSASRSDGDNPRRHSTESDRR
jgi:hypothetical protein